VLTGHAPSRATLEALAAGAVVAFDDQFSDNGRGSIGGDWTGGVATFDVVVPEHVPSRFALISPQAAARVGTVAPEAVLIDFAGPISPQDEARIDAALTSLGLMSGSLEVSGPPDHRVVMTAAGSVAVGLVLLAVTVVVALMIKDSAETRRSLAAVGTTRGVLRWQAAVQTLATVGPGVLLGVVAGQVPTLLMMLAARGRVAVTVPWQVDGALLIVPLVTAAAAAVLARLPQRLMLSID